MQMISEQDLRLLCERGEDSQHQFKVELNSLDQLAVEISAFANTNGGQLWIGIADSGRIVGLSSDQIRCYNQWISNAASQKIEPALLVTTELLTIEGKHIMCLQVLQGKQKPYFVNGSEVWVKNGADKRRAKREELRQLMQASHGLYADELSCGIDQAHLDKEYFSQSYRRYFGEFLDVSDIPQAQLLKNLKLIGEEHKLTLAGMLLFGKDTATLLPQYGLKMTVYGEGEDNIVDKLDARGRLLDIHAQALAFCQKVVPNLKIKDVNDPSQKVVPEAVFNELLANALVHRDYFVSGQIQGTFRPDSFELSSPGCLPNSLEVCSIQYGVHVERNPILLSFLEREPHFGYTGRGSGIPRVQRLMKDLGVRIEFENDTVTKRFIVRCEWGQ
jgi:ATP-dependent DNA helicase RecG